MSGASDRITIREAALILNACDAYVQWLLQSGALRTRADEKGVRLLSREAVTRYMGGDRSGASGLAESEESADNPTIAACG